VNKRQLWALAGLSVLAVVDLGSVRIALPVLRRRWASFPGLPLLERWEAAVVVMLMTGAVLFVLWLAWGDFAEQDTPFARKSTHILLLFMGIAEVFHLVWPQPAWMDSTRHVLAVVTVIVIAADALLYGTTLARAAVGLAAIALLSSTLFRAVVIYFPAAGSARWLAIMSEATSLVVPWVLAVAVTRRQMDDLIALSGAVIAVIFSAVAIYGVTPAVHLLIAQAIGFRFALPPPVHLLTVGASFYVVIRALRSSVIPGQVPWAYLWLMACGIQMNRPYVQMGALTALAVLAWTPPPRLPSDFRRCTFVRKPYVPASGPVSQDDLPEEALIVT